MAHEERATLTIAPPLLPAEVALRAFAAQRHLPKRNALGTICLCGAPLPCPTATALLADIAADWARVQSAAREGCEGCETHPEPGADTTT